MVFVAETGPDAWRETRSSFGWPPSRPPETPLCYTVFNDSRIETDSYAVFGQLTWNITDRLHLTPKI